MNRKRGCTPLGSLFHIFYDDATFCAVQLLGFCTKSFLVMRKFDTGKGYITLWALLGIWSVSALTSLPGLAVSPISEELAVIFPKASEVDIQMLTTLPSLLIIPFILLAGFISERVGYMRLLYIGLWLFLLSGALYFVCGSITQLIVVSVFLGVGAGIIVPLSTALVSKFFTGAERTRQYGYVSAITNIALVLATAVTGWLADIQWRLPFLVYLLPVFSIILLPAIKRDAASVGNDVKHFNDTASAGDFINYRSLSKYMFFYLLITYLVMAVSIDLPFLLGKLGHDSAVAGLVTAVFFLSMMTPGLFINRILALLKGNILWVSLLFIALGLLDISLNSSLLFIVIGCIVAGFGYGMAQPYIYDATASLASAKKVTTALALVMTMNYVAIVVSPFVIELLQDLSGVKGEASSFLLNSIVGFVFLVPLVLNRLFVKR